MRTRFARFIRVAAVTTAVGGFALLSSSRGEAAASHTVDMDGTGFNPAEITIAVGDTIQWVNKDPFPHTATSEAGGFDSDKIAAGKSWKFTFKKKGDFDYVCTYHDTMTGKIHVQ